MPRQQGIGALAPRAKVRDPLETAAVTFEQAAGRRLVGAGRRLGTWLCRAVRPPGGGVAPLPQRGRDHGRLDPLLAELEHQDVLASRVGPVAGFDPGAGEGLVVEHPELAEPGDDALDEIRPVAGLRQSTPHLRHGSLARLEKVECCGQDDLRVVDLRPPSAAFGG